VKKTEVSAWYQQLSTYEGEQDTFHRRHLVDPLAKKILNMKCNTCHQGNDPREETVGASADGPGAATQRKMVDPDVCLMCHGKFPWEHMTGLTGPWTETGKTFGNNCMACHAVFRTNRHNVNYLNTKAIEKEGATNGDVCYGCHGGRAWYRISYPYPRHSWPTMGKEIPEWAKDRPTESQARFLIKTGTSTPPSTSSDKTSKALTKPEAPTKPKESSSSAASTSSAPEEPKAPKKPITPANTDDKEEKS
jgi:hypothetical protein